MKLTIQAMKLKLAIFQLTLIACQPTPPSTLTAKPARPSAARTAQSAAQSAPRVAPEAEPIPVVPRCEGERTPKALQAQLDRRGPLGIIDRHGNMYAVDMSWHLVAGVNMMSGQRERVAVLTKINRSGDIGFSREIARLAGADGDTKLWLATTQSGVFVAGAYTGMLTIAGHGSSNTADDEGHDIFVVKLDDAGDLVWSRSYGNQHRQRVEDIATDASGALYLAGSSDGDFDIEHPEQPPRSSDGSSFLAKIDGSGDIAWSKRHSRHGYPAVQALARRAGSGMWVAGEYLSSGDMGCGRFPAPQHPRGLFVAAVDGNGGCLVSRGFAGQGWQRVEALSVSRMGAVAMAGPNIGAVHFGGGAVEGKRGSGRSSTGYAVAFDASGRHQFSTAVEDGFKRRIYHRADGSLLLDSGWETDGVIVFDDKGERLATASPWEVAILAIDDEGEKPPRGFVCELACRHRLSCIGDGACTLTHAGCDVMTDADCARSYLCSDDGKCRAQAGRCVAHTDADCAGSTGCKRLGACTAKDGSCVATTPGCAAAAMCHLEGVCVATENGCAAVSDSMCASSRACSYEGRCGLSPHYMPLEEGAGDGRCHAVSAADCRKSEACKRFGLCTLGTGPDGWGQCRAQHARDCRQAQICRTRAACSVATSIHASFCALRSDSDCRRSDLCKLQGRCRLARRDCVK